DPDTRFKAREWSFWLGMTLSNLADLLGNLPNRGDRRRDRELAVREGLAILKDLATRHPVPSYKNELANAYNNLGNFENHDGRYGEAGANYQQALGLFSRLASEFPTVADYKAREGMVLYNLGNMALGQAKRGERAGLLLQALPGGAAAPGVAFGGVFRWA